MKYFREWQSGVLQKPWKASKDEAIKYWSSLAPGVPITDVRTIPQGHKGSTYGLDGIRITGSASFINAVISRLKDLLNYEGKGTRLQINFSQQVDSKTDIPVPGSYVFYIQVAERDSDEEKIKLAKPSFKKKKKTK